MWAVTVRREADLKYVLEADRPLRMTEFSGTFKASTRRLCMQELDMWGSGVKG